MTASACSAFPNPPGNDEINPTEYCSTYDASKAEMELLPVTSPTRICSGVNAMALTEFCSSCAPSNAVTVPLPVTSP